MKSARFAISAEILDPVALAGSVAEHPWRPLDALRGKVVGFIDNSKPNFQHLVDDISQFLVSRYGVASVVKHRKFAASIPAPADILEDIEEKCDLVITGSGD
ncbi:MAG: hypothetical protein A3G24_04660 [Betaproteobacteria bacterium RIFCSPLOWO2_12_FULL_62_13]|nr:MAG: hypothetical protein A3G24_04660 [Betaproteobacteria bacterium RIFCSPLOWO2_12_FULL_62_13]